MHICSALCTQVLNDHVHALSVFHVVENRASPKALLGTSLVLYLPLPLTEATMYLLNLVDIFRKRFCATRKTTPQTC